MLLINLGVLVVTVGLMVAAGEILLRRAEGRSDDTPLHTSTLDPFIPRLIPNTRAVRNGVEIRTNSLGFRGGEIDTTRHPYRVLCVGDSYVFGSGVEEAETIPSRLQQHLGAALGGGAVECVNLGIDGANAYDHRVRIERLGLPLEPDLVLYFYLFNDLWQMERGVDWMANRRQGLEGARAAHEGRKRQSYVVRYLRPRLAALARAVLGRKAGAMDVWDAQYHDDVPAWQVTKPEILRARDLTEAAGARFVFALLPAFAEFRDGVYPLDTYREVVTAFCRAHGIAFIDLHEPFWGGHGRRYWINPMDPHPNGEACEMMARHVASRLLELGLRRGE
jgi:lysophospholipase L1-like esterase